MSIMIDFSMTGWSQCVLSGQHKLDLTLYNKYYRN